MLDVVFLECQEYLLQLLSSIITLCHQLLIISGSLVLVKIQSKVISIEFEFVSELIHLIDASLESIDILELLLLLLEIFTEHLELLHFLMEVKLVVGHDIVKLCLRLLISTQLILETLKYLFLGWLLPHVIILRLLFLSCIF
jgi:hypothetical protein